jgi:hypothetical protein
MPPENRSSRPGMMPDNMNSLAVLRRSAIKSNP